jgi:hypothetical protein
MAQPFTLDVQGLGNLEKRIKGLPAKLQKEVDGELFAGTNAIHRRQLRAVPVNTGRLKQGIPDPHKVKDLEYELTSNALYSPYVEFGTGKLVSVPDELKDFAIQFKGRGIRQVNLPARPYFFPAFFLERPLIIERVKKVINDI